MTDLDLAPSGAFALAVLRARERLRAPAPSPAAFAAGAALDRRVLAGEAIGSAALSRRRHHAPCSTPPPASRRWSGWWWSTLGAATRRAAARAAEEGGARGGHRPRRQDRHRPAHQGRRRPRRAQASTSRPQIDRSYGYTIVNLQHRLRQAAAHQRRGRRPGAHPRRQPRLRAGARARGWCSGSRWAASSSTTSRWAARRSRWRCWATAVKRVFVSQEHPEGRISFINWETGRGRVGHRLRAQRKDRAMNRSPRAACCWPLLALAGWPAAAATRTAGSPAPRARCRRWRWAPAWPTSSRPAPRPSSIDPARGQPAGPARCRWARTRCWRCPAAAARTSCWCCRRGVRRRAGARARAGRADGDPRRRRQAGAPASRWPAASTALAQSARRSLRGAALRSRPPATRASTLLFNPNEVAVLDLDAAAAGDAGLAHAAQLRRRAPGGGVLAAAAAARRGSGRAHAAAGGGAVRQLPDPVRSGERPHRDHRLADPRRRDPHRASRCRCCSTASDPAQDPTIFVRSEGSNDIVALRLLPAPAAPGRPGQRLPPGAQPAGRRRRAHRHGAVSTRGRRARACWCCRPTPARRR